MSNNIGNISRRNFFKLALGGAVVAASATPAIASLLKETYTDQIRYIMGLHGKLVSMKETGEHNGPEFNKTFNDLLQFICDKFSITSDDAEYEASQIAVGKIFNREVSADAWKDVPPTLPRAAVAVSVIRDLLSVQRIRIYPDQTPAFEEFADKFQDLILSA